MLGYDANAVQPPAPGSNYYKISDNMGILVKNPWKLQNTFQFNFYIKRGTEIITSPSESGTFYKTVTFPETPNAAGLQTVYIGAVTVNPITTTQTGDELWVDLKVQSDVGEYQTVLKHKIYTH